MLNNNLIWHTLEVTVEADAIFGGVYRPHHVHGSAKRCIIRYKDGSSYTIKNVACAISVPEKSQQELAIYYTRPAEGYDTGDYKVWDAAPVSKVVTIKAADVKELEFVLEGKRVIINKF